MKTYLITLLATVATAGVATTTLAQTPAPDAATLMNMGRFGEAKFQLIRNAQQNPSMQTNFDVGYGYLLAGQPDSAHTWFEKGLSMDEKRVPLNETGIALTYIAQNNAANADPKLEEVIKKSKRL